MDVCDRKPQHSDIWPPENELNMQTSVVYEFIWRKYIILSEILIEINVSKSRFAFPAQRN